MTTNTEDIARQIIGHLEQAWNDGDGNAFGEPFAPDADFVDIRGDHHRSQAAIAAGHQGIMDSIYKGSQIKYDLIGARMLADDVMLIHVTGDLSVPAGPLAGQHRALPSMVVVREGDAWKIASFHNTLVAPK